MEKKKLSLDELRIRSFVTDVPKQKRKTYNGGIFRSLEIICSELDVCDYTDGCPSDSDCFGCN